MIKILIINVNIFVEFNNVFGSGRLKVSLRKCKYLFFWLFWIKYGDNKIYIFYYFYVYICL